MNLKVREIEIQYVHKIWPNVRHYVVDALEKGVPYNKDFMPFNADHILAFLASGQWLLLVGVDEQGEIHGAGTLSFTNYPLVRAATITSTGGKFLANKDIIEQVKGIARKYGATVLQAYCRDSMVRLMQRSGFEPHNRLVEQKL